MISCRMYKEGSERLDVDTLKGVDPRGDELSPAHGGLSLRGPASEARSLDNTGEMV